MWCRRCRGRQRRNVKSLKIDISGNRVGAVSSAGRYDGGKNVALFADLCCYIAIGSTEAKGV